MNNWKSCLSGLKRSTFIGQNVSWRYKYVVVENNRIFDKDECDSLNEYSETVIIRMIEFLIDNICEIWWSCISVLKIFRTCILMGTKWAPLVAVFFLLFIWSWFCTKRVSSRNKILYSHFSLYRLCFYLWIALSSMIILMLYIQRNLRLKTLQMLQDRPMILTFVWSWRW